MSLTHSPLSNFFIRSLSFLSVLLLLLYPFLVHWGLKTFSLTSVSLGLIGLFVLRFSFVKALRNPNLKSLLNYGSILIVIAIGLNLCALIWQNPMWLKLYPPAMSASFLFLFAHSLTTEQTMVERFARLKEPDLPGHAMSYTRWATVAWCGFFFVNMTLSLYTVFFTFDKAWVLYNGFLSYIGLGIFFSLEFGIRILYRRKKEGRQ